MKKRTMREIIFTLIIGIPLALLIGLARKKDNGDDGQNQDHEAIKRN
jgi:hypothetical protein